MASCTERGFVTATRGPRAQPWRALLTLVALLAPFGAPAADLADANDARVAAHDVLLEASVDTDSPYVQARVRYRVRVMARVPLRDATLSAPAAEGALIRRLGDDQRFDVQQNGRRYRVSERLYLVVAERPGTLTITGPSLLAAVPVRALEGGAEDELIERRAVISRTAPDLLLKVRAPPRAAERPWLPAESVSISERWRPESAQARVGEPIEREIVIEAAGIGASAVALPQMHAVDGLRIYPRPVKHDERQIGDDLSVTTTLRQTLVPTVPGILELPAFRLPWWSLGMDAARAASLPARDLVVAGGGQESPPGRPATSSLQDFRARFLERADADWWGPPGLLLVLGLACLATLRLWLRRRCGHRQGRESLVRGATTAAGTTPAQWARQLRKACEGHDPGAARAVLVAWAAAQRNGGRGIMAVLRARGVNEAQLARVRELDRQIYGRGGADSKVWKGNALLDSVLPLLEETDTRKARVDAERLPPLFPVPSRDG